ncbi:MAG: glycosyltransferase family 4 protein [Candidatus Helarchaeota archaeon]
MKIGIISDTFLPLIGGAEIHIYNLSRKLMDLGYNITIFTLVDGPENIDGIKVIRAIKKNEFIWILKNIKRLINFIKSVDIIHGHYTYFLSCLSSIISKLLKKPCIITLHGLGTLNSSVGNSPLKKFYRKMSFHFADIIISTSNEMAKLATNFKDSKRIIVIPNAVDPNIFKPIKKDDNRNKIIVFSPRRLNRKNGVQYLIEAIPYILQKNKNIEFWITGEEKLKPYLEKRVATLNIKKYVKFLGYISNQQMINYYAQADIVVFPSSAESTSIACLEALAMEKPVVASALKPYKDLLEKTNAGVLVKLFDRDYSDYNAPITLPVNRIKELANAIILLVKNPNLRKNFGKNGRIIVLKKYNWDLIIKKISKIYELLLKSYNKKDISNCNNK